ncbi:MAG: GGDEF domain-containing protein [Microthrixaceae bacterium]
MLTRLASPRSPSDLVLVAACLWAAAFGAASTIVGAQPDILFHVAVWPPVLALIALSIRRSTESSWQLMAAGVVLFGLGDVAWEIIRATGQDPDASWADIVYLSGYVALAAGVGLLLARHGGPRRRDGLIDGALLAIPAAVLVTQFLVVPGDDSGAAIGARILGAMYPLADTLLVAAVVWLLVTPGLKRKVSGLVAAGLAMTLVLDTTWAAAALTGNTAASRIADGLFPLSYALLAAGAALGACSPIDISPDAHRNAVPWGRVVLLATGLVAAPLTAALAITSDNRIQPVLVVLGTLAAATLVVLRFVRLVNDLNRTTEELSEARNEILLQAVVDPLTGAYNRLMLPDQLDQLASGGSTTSAVMSIDLDRFKQVNDERGHQAGDLVLATVVERLTAATRGHDVVIRMGGDEFLVILHDIGHDDALHLAERIVGKVEEPIDFQGTKLSVSASVGVAMVPGGRTDTDDVLHRADLAMYEAKRSAAGVQLASA